MNKRTSHYRRCSSNPNVESTHSKVVFNSSRQIVTKETKEKLSAIRSRFIEEKGGCGFNKVKWYKVSNILDEEFICRGTWERDIALWLNDHNVLWIRKVYVKYKTNDGVIHTYAPDIYLPDTNEYIEVKGYFSDRDKYKMKLVCEQHNISIRLFEYEQYKRLKGFEDLKSLLTNCRDALSVCESSDETIIHIPISKPVHKTARQPVKHRIAKSVVIREKNNICQALNCNNGAYVKYCSRKCSSTAFERGKPPLDKLANELMHSPLKDICALYNVSAMTIYRWADSYGINARKRNRKPSSHRCPICNVNITANRISCSSECKAMRSRIATRPSKEQLKHEIETCTMVSLGIKYGVSNSAVRRWCQGAIGFQTMPKT